MTSEDKMSMSLDDIIRKEGKGTAARRGGRGGRGARGRGRGRGGRGAPYTTRGGGGTAATGGVLRARGRGRGRSRGAFASRQQLLVSGGVRGRGRGRPGGRFRSASRGRGTGGATGARQRWARSRSRSRGPGDALQNQQRARSRSRGPAGGPRGRSRSRGRSALGGGNVNSRSRSRSRVPGGARSRSRSRGAGGAQARARSAGRGRSRSRSRPPTGALLQSRSRSRSRSAVRSARSLTPVARGRGQRAPPRLVLFRAAPGSVPWPQAHRLVRSRVRRAARFLNQRGRQTTAPHGAAGLNSEWKMAGTFRSDYIQRQRNYHSSVASNLGDLSSDMLFGSGDGGGNQLLVNIQNEYAMHPAPGARRTWQRSRGLRRNQFVGVVGHRPQIDVASVGDATTTALEPASVRQTVALRGSTRSTAHNGLPRKMTESPAQLVPTLVVEQNIVENMGQPSASTTRMTLSERFTKQHSVTEDAETVYTQVEN